MLAQLMAYRCLGRSALITLTRPMTLTTHRPDAILGGMREIVPIMWSGVPLRETR